MKKTIVHFSLLLFVTTATIHSQQTVSLDTSQNPIFNGAGLTYDSVMVTLSNKNIAFDVKFEMVRDIEDMSSNDKKEKAIIVYNRILIDAKKETDKHYIIDLYCALANSYMLENKLYIAKCYLDSAFLHEKETDNLSSLALMNFIMSRYYLMEGKEDKGHEYLFRTISYFEKTQGKESTAILLLYNLSEAYYEHNDIDGLKKVLDKMIPLTNKDKHCLSYIYTYTVVTAYNRLLYNKEQDSQYLDTIMGYDKKIIKIYEKADPVDRNMAIPLVVQHYMNIADIMASMSNPDWKKIIEYIDTASEMARDQRYIGSIDNDIMLHRLKGRVLLYQGKYNEALVEAKKSFKILEEEAPENKIFLYIPIYSLLADIYEKKEDYHAALKYTKLKNGVEFTINEARKYDVIKELQTKYDVTKKDLQISQFNEEKHKTQFIGMLIIGSLVFAIIVIFTLFLYNRMRLLKKEFDFKNLQKDLQNKLSEQYISGLETERTRLAKELHDGIGNELLSVIMQINNDIDKLTTTDKLNDTYHHVRDLSHSLIPPALTNVTFAIILEDFVRKHNDASKIKIELNMPSCHDNWKNLPPNYALEAYRIIQEAVSNSMKHANASTMSIEAFFEDNLLSVCIMDNGKGFEVHAPNKGIGIKIMKERAKHMKSTLNIQSEINKGTTISFRFNIPSFS